MQQRAPRIPELDGLRGFAALFVLFGHFPWIEHLTFIRKTAAWFDSASLGVDIFFALSGFLITRIILAEKRNGSFSFRRFYARRTLRIFPIYYLTLLVVGLFITWRHAGWLALYVGNFVFAFDPEPHPLRHTWSLAVEEHFYLVWPLLLATLDLRTAKRLIFPFMPILAIALALLVSQLIDTALADALIIRGSMFRVVAICLGAWVAFEEGRLRRLSPHWVLLLGALAIYVPHLTIQSQTTELAGLVITNFTIKIVLLSLSSLCWLLVALNLDQLAARFPVLRVPRAVFTNPLSRFMGVISYGLYLYHYPLLYATDLLDGATVGLGRAGAMLAIILIVSIASWYAVERPLLRLNKPART